MNAVIFSLILGTATPGGGFPVYGDAFAAMYSSPGLFIVKGDSPLRTISDLKGRPVVLGTRASGITALGRTVLQSLEIPVQEIFLEKAADGPPMLLDGRAVGRGRGLAGIHRAGEVGNAIYRARRR